MSPFLGPFLLGFASCGALLFILALGIWLGANIVAKKAAKDVEAIAKKD